MSTERWPSRQGNAQALRLVAVLGLEAQAKVEVLGSSRGGSHYGQAGTGCTRGDPLSSGLYWATAVVPCTARPWCCLLPPYGRVSLYASGLCERPLERPSRSQPGCRVSTFE